MSKQPRKQRKALYTAPLHQRRKRMSVNLSHDLREELGRRSLPVKVGDKVTVLRGDFKGQEGEVEAIDIKKYKVTIDGVTINKADGNSAFLEVHPSNLMITDADLDDDRRNKHVKEE
jgi:large subunit ribosomal protein L24